MPAKVFILLIITAFLWGSTPIIEKIALQTTDPLVGLTIRTLFITFVMIIVCAVAGKWPNVINTPLKDKIYFSITGLMAGLLGMLTYYLALKASPASKVVPIAACYPLVAALLGVVFLGEAVTWIRFLGTVLIIAGVWLVK